MRIRKDKELRVPSSKVRKISLLGEDEGYTDSTLNYIPEGKGYKCAPLPVMTTYYGTLPGNPIALHYSQANGAFFFVTQDGVYLTDKSKNKTHQKIYSDSSPLPFFVDMYINGFSCTVMFCGTQRVVYNGTQVETFTDTRQFRAGVMHCGRFFGADYSDGVKLWWAATHAADWTEGIGGCGYIFLPPEGGAIVRLFSYGDRLVVLRERGITVVRAYGEPQHYSVESCASYLVTEGIIGETCAFAGGKILFCTPYALYAFDGNSTERLCELGEGKYYLPQSAVGMGDIYCLKCAYDGIGCIMGYDCVTGKVWKCYTLCTLMCVCSDAIYIFSQSSVYYFDRSQCALAKWHSKETDFGTDGVKLLKSINITGKNSIFIIVKCDGVQRTYEGTGRHKIMMHGRKFTFTVTANGDLQEIVAELEVRDGI